MLSCPLGNQVPVLQPSPGGRTDGHRVCVAGGDDHFGRGSVPGAGGGRGVPKAAGRKVPTQTPVGPVHGRGHETKEDM